MGTAENQNEPVTKTCFAPPRNASLPSTAASARPFAIALLQADRSGSTPTGSQLDPRCSRNPQRTSSRISAAPLVVAQRAQAAGERGVDQLLVVPGVVLERADQDAGQVIARLGGGLPHAGQVVEGVVAEVGVVRRGDPGRPGRAPRRGAVVGALRDQDLAPPGLRAGDRAAHGGGVGAVLGEDRPVRVPHGRHQQLGQVHHDRAGRVHAVADPGLRSGRRLHRRVLVAEHDRAVAAHQVDVLVAVHVPDPRAAAAPHELRVAGARGGLVPVHPARDHGPGALAQLPVGGALSHDMCSFIRPATAGCVPLRKSSTWPRFSIPASEPRPVATRAPQARPSQAASSWRWRPPAARRAGRR